MFLYKTQIKMTTYIMLNADKSSFQF